MRHRTKWGKKQKRRAINSECVRQRLVSINSLRREFVVGVGENRACFCPTCCRQTLQQWQSLCFSVSDMKIRALCPISGSNDSRKRHEMRLISKLGTVHPLGINESFSYI